MERLTFKSRKGPVKTMVEWEMIGSIIRRFANIITNIITVLMMSEGESEDMSLNELAKEAHKIAVEHGWWDPEPTFGELVALMHSELSEALEEYRAGRPMVWYECKFDGEPCDKVTYETKKCNGEYLRDKPEGIAVELADCIIRILDWAGHEGVDLDAIIREKMDYNRTRPYRHGGKKL